MKKISTILAVIILMVLIIISFGNLNYSGYQARAAHYICNSSWSDEKCIGCHVNVYDDVVNSYHVQLVNKNVVDGQWDLHFLNLIEKEDKQTLVRGCGQCHPMGIPSHNPTIAAVAGQSECSRCHSKDDLVFEIHNKDEIVGGSITTDCQICHSDNISNEFLYLTHISDSTCANKCHQTDVAKRAVMWSSTDYAEYDVHAKAGVGCTQCHITSNHQIGKGNTIDRPNPTLSFDQPMKQCVDCHFEVTHGMIVDAHLENVACEACHIPILPGGNAKYSIDWTNGYKDIKFQTDDFRPVLAWFNGTVNGIAQPSNKDDPGAVLKPFNVIAITWWDEGNNLDIVNNPNLSNNWGSPVVLSHIRAADINADDKVSTDEIREFDLENYGIPEYPNAVLRHLDMYYSVSHNIVGEESALGKSALWCADCHGNTSSIDWVLLGYEADPAQTDPPTDFTNYEVTVEIIPARPKPVEVENEPWLFDPFGAGD
ncbi:MAG: methanogenesis multiheme c-type cytochrome [Methanosarcinales archaeon]|nr:methanogenesis multiheme c-type cytochrome [Methanosarcinales archaeon]